ncbi:MAG: T9SS type A sorting domain-containing protein, partial [Bacteroidota bacterium]
NSSVLYYGTQRLYRSASKASSWTAISGDLTKGEHESGTQKYGTITSIAAAKSDSDVIYVGTDDGNVQVTYDLGANWQLVSDSLPNRYVTGLAVDPVDAFTAYVTFSGYRHLDYQPHILVTRDGGAHWFDISANLPEIPINDILLDPQHNGHIYIANDLGVWVTTNRGQAWELLGKELPMTVVTDLELHHPTRSLIAATYGRSMYKYELEPKEQDDNRFRNPELDPTVVLFQAYPNPIQAEETIAIQVEKDMVGQLKAYNEMGQCIFEKTTSLVAGKNYISLHLGHLEKGTYWLTLEHQNQVLAKQILWNH